MTDHAERFETKVLEAKSEPGARAHAGDAQALFAEMMHAFETFKQDNDQRLEAIERRGAADPLIEEKLERLNRAIDGAKAALDRQAVDRARPQLEIGRPAEADEYKHAFAAYVKRGEEKGLNSGTNADGGFVVPAEVESTITRRMTAISPIRSIATVRQISTGTYRKPVTLTGPQVGWAGETASRPTTDSPTIDALAFPAAELYAMPAASTAFLDDAAVDIGEWLADEVNAAFAAQETTAFVSGDGTNKPRGFLDYTLSAEASWEWGEIGYVATGEAGAWPDADESDVLIDLVYTLKAGYRQNASWVMNRRTQSAIRKFKDVDGNYLWQPANSADGRATLLGFPLVEAEDMPDIGTSTTPIAFGDFRRGYLVVDRQGVNVLRDPYSAKPHVLFYTTKRVGGGVQDFDAIKLLKFAAS